VGLFLYLGLRRAQRQPQQAAIDMPGEKKAAATRKSSVSSRAKRKSARARRFFGRKNTIASGRVSLIAF
jgi:hypothetical protein